MKCERGNKENKDGVNKVRRDNRIDNDKEVDIKKNNHKNINQ
jgi:hypothetical protein